MNVISNFPMRSLVPLLLLITASCAARFDKEKLNEVMNEWIGAHQSELIAQWGPPARTASDGKGGAILVYQDRVSLGQRPGYASVDYFGNVRYTNPQQVGYEETSLFYIDADGYIYSWRWQRE